MFITNKLPSFHLWWKENLVKHRKTSKYYETDYLENILLPFIFLLTTNFVKTSHIQTKKFLIFLKNILNQTWNAFNTKFLCQWKDRKSIYQVKEAFALFCCLISMNFRLNMFQIPKTYQNSQKIINFEGVLDELHSKKVFHRQSFTKYLRLTLISIWKSTPREKFNSFFLGLSC